MNTTLIIMAAGIGSRFGEGIKQLAQMGPNGEIIMDYSIHDAKEAGFNKVVFIIRKDIFKEFEEIIGNRIKEQIDVEYVFQELDDLPEGFEVPEGRTKPWGTGQAVLCCKDVVKEPFVIINADDYYGKEAFVRLHDFLGKRQDHLLASIRHIQTIITCTGLDDFISHSFQIDKTFRVVSGTVTCERPNKTTSQT